METRERERERDSREPGTEPERETQAQEVGRERCAVSDWCEGTCRDLHLLDDGRRCPAWFVDDMTRRRSSVRGRASRK